jgi:glycosyltransferase involved in cell wall biosynthesis
MSPTLSIVIIGRNEGERLLRCIESARAIRMVGGTPSEIAGGDTPEIIYVDSGSRDGSANGAAARGVRVIALTTGLQTAARARNAGWRAATGTFVLFLDGDTIVAPEFVVNALPEFENPRIAVVWGDRRETHPTSSLYNRVLDLDWIQHPGFTDSCSGDALTRRAALEEVGGYDDELIAGEEADMCRRLRARGHLILHVTLPMTRHDLAMTRWSQYWRRAYRSGYAYAQVSDRYRGTGLPVWENEVRGNRLRAVVLLAAPLVGGAVSVGSRSWWPVVIVPMFYAALVLRTAYKYRWKGGSVTTRLLYGLHSHFQQVPILIGQIAWLRDLRAGRRRALIEYKESASVSNARQPRA